MSHHLQADLMTTSTLARIKVAVGEAVRDRALHNGIAMGSVGTLINTMTCAAMGAASAGKPDSIGMVFPSLPPVMSGAMVGFGINGLAVAGFAVVAAGGIALNKVMRDNQAEMRIAVARAKADVANRADQPSNSDKPTQ